MSIVQLGFKGKWAKFLEYYPIILVCGLLLSLITFIIFPDSAKRVYFFMGGITSLIWLYERKSPIPVIKILLIVMLVFSAYRIGHTMIAAHSYDLNIIFRSWLDKNYIGSSQRIFFGVVIISYLYTKKLDIKWFASVFQMVLRLFLIIPFILIFSSVENFEMDRANFLWKLNAILATCLIVAVYTIFLSEWMKKEQYAWFNLLDIAMVSACVLVLIWFSGTRSALLTVFLVSGCLYISSNIPYKRITLLILFIFVAIVVGAYGVQIKEQLRLNQAISEIGTYEKNLDHKSSIGSRFEMWRAAGLIAVSNPIFGVGSEQRKELIEQFVESDQIGPGGVLLHMHNEFLEELSVRGSIGLILVCTFYFSIIRLAFYNRTQYGVSTSLLALVGTYILFGMIDVVLVGRETSLIFILLLIMLLINEQKRFVSKNIIV